MIPAMAPTMAPIPTLECALSGSLPGSLLLVDLALLDFVPAGRRAPTYVYGSLVDSDYDRRRGRGPSHTHRRGRDDERIAGH